MKILIIDDSKVNQHIIGSYVTESSHEVFYSQNIQQARQSLEFEKPQLIIIDSELPDFGAFDFVKDLRKLQENNQFWTPVIFIFSTLNDAILTRCLESGGDDYLVKPLSKLLVKAKISAFEHIAEKEQQLLQSLKTHLSLNEKLKQANEKLRLLSTTDPLTGIKNRRAFDEDLKAACQNALRTRTSLSLLMIDIDNFKHFNDHFGHNHGDRALQTLALTLENQLPRATDLLSRIGGEEFCIILPFTDQNGASIVAQRVLDAVRNMSVELSHQKKVGITVSIGVFSASKSEQMQEEQITKCADQALYLAKQQGKDRTIIYKNED